MKTDSGNQVLIDEKYQVQRKVGEGAFCKVYKVKDDQGDVYAAKVWKSTNIQMFKDERKACDLAQHQNLVKYHKAVTRADMHYESTQQTKKVSYILMEYMDGNDFSWPLIGHKGLSEDICR